MTTTPILVNAAGSSGGGGVREILAAREIVSNLVRRDLKTRYRGTFLGLLWSLATPALMVALYTFIFEFIFRLRPTPDTAYPFAVFFFCGLVLWNFFSVSVSGATGSVIGSAYLLQKLAFPRTILPLTSVLSALVTLGFEGSVLLGVAWALRIWPTPWILLAPAVVAIVFVLAYGLGLLLSALTVFFRDIAHFISIALQLWFWGTPIIYSLELVADRPRLRMLLVANPMTGLVTSFRNVVLDGVAPDPMLLAYSLAVATAVLVAGAIVFRRTQRLFPELI